MWQSTLYHLRYRNVDFMDLDEVVTTTSLEDRRRLRQLFTDLFPKDPCHVFSSPYLVNARIPPVNSASDSIMVIADLNIPRMVSYNNIIFKITFHNLLTNQYVIENKVYEFLSKFELPFVMQYLNTYHCDDFRSVTSNEGSVLEQIYQRYKSLITYNVGRYDFKRAQILVCERGGGKSLADSAATLQPDEWLPIFVQIVFTLAFFEEIGLMHHDLHLGNVWLDRVDQAYEYILHVDKQMEPIRITTDRIVKIYDFDHATVVPTKYNRSQSSIVGQPNTFLYDLCPMIGECNRMRIGRDYAQVCWWLINTVPNLPPVIRQSIEQSVTQDFLTNKAVGRPGGSLAWSGHPCQVRRNSPCEHYKLNSVRTLAKKLAASLGGKAKQGNALPQEFWLPSCRET